MDSIDKTVPAIPKCKTERGFDTNVKIYPDYNNPERFRQVSVKCTKHNISARYRFRTLGFTGDEIAEAQKKAFDACFKAVEKECLSNQKPEYTGQSFL
jgi:hypothetical protein